MPSKDLKLHHIGQKMDWKKIAELADTPPSPIVEYFCGKKHDVQLGGIPPFAEKFSNIAFDGHPKANKCMTMLKPGCKK